MTVKRKSLMLITILLALFLIITGCSSSSVNEDETSLESETKNETEEKDTEEEESDQESEQVAGGELRIALSAAPSNLDQPTSTNTSTRDVSRLMFETLLTVNSKYQPVPMLAESFDVSEDGKTYT